MDRCGFQWRSLYFYTKTSIELDVPQHMVKNEQVVRRLGIANHPLQQASDEVENSQQELVVGFVRIYRKMLLIPFAFVLLRTPETIFRILEYTGYPSRSAMADVATSNFGRVLSVLQALLNPAQGTVNFLIWIMTSPLYRARLWGMWTGEGKSDHSPLEEPMLD